MRCFTQSQLAHHQKYSCASDIVSGHDAEKTVCGICGNAYVTAAHLELHYAEDHSPVDKDEADTTPSSASESSVNRDPSDEMGMRNAPNHSTVNHLSLSEPSHGAGGGGALNALVREHHHSSVHQRKQQHLAQVTPACPWLSQRHEQLAHICTACLVDSTSIERLFSYELHRSRRHH